MIKQAYAGEALSSSRLFEWPKRFREGKDSVQNDPKADTDSNVERARQVLHEERRVTVRMISELNLNRDVCKILCEDLGKRKLNARIVFHSLTNKQREGRRKISAELLDRARRDPTFVSEITVTFSCFPE
ncbi:protein GVQW3-like [Stegodyphus dumicola]|uniref:protein GVQW3-like n=1 Tax=Stegodyphus dumicola TaxID=202533 RepID=UPI0015B1328B|nr:protein GVQW3-like [Stegodyphus dumicola]